MLQQLAIQRHVAVCNGLDRIAFFCKLSCLPAHLLARRGKAALQCSGHLSDITVRVGEAGLPLHDQFPAAARTRRDAGQARGHGLQDNIGQPLLERREDERFRTLVIESDILRKIP